MVDNPIRKDFKFWSYNDDKSDPKDSTNSANLRKIAGCWKISAECHWPLMNHTEQHAEKSRRGSLNGTKSTPVAPSGPENSKILVVIKSNRLMKRS